MFGLSFLKSKKVPVSDTKMVRVLFVCTGNICRSPTAHGVFQSLVDEQGLGDQVLVDSAGTHSYFKSSQPDLRSQAAAKGHGVKLSGLRSRKLVSDDFLKFDFLLAMDCSNYESIQLLQPEAPRAKIAMMLEYSEKYSQLEIPDPYYGDDGFELVFDMVADASAGLLRAIRRQYSI